MPQPANLPAPFSVDQSQFGKHYVEYVLSRRGWQDKVVLKAPHARFQQSPLAKDRFCGDVALWIDLGLHPHVESCYGLASAQDASYFVEHIEGISLKSWIEKGRCSLRSILSVAIQICHGLDHIHKKKISPVALSPESVSVTASSVAKIKDVFLPETGADKKNGHSFIQKGVFDFGSLLWFMLCDNKAPEGLFEDLPPPVFRKEYEPYCQFLFPFLKQCLAPGENHFFRGTGHLLSALNRLYVKIFGVDCPYSKYDAVFFAEGYNNEAVFLFETGCYKEGFLKLQQALSAQDRLSEAVYNHIVYRMRSGLYPPQQIVSMVESAKFDSSIPEYLHLLLTLVRKLSRKGTSPRSAAPPFLFCPPPQTLFFYRRSRETKSEYKVCQKHFATLGYEACLQSLILAWKKKKFGKDSFLAGLYEQLLTKGGKNEIVAVQRYCTIKGQGQPVTDLAYLPGTKKIVHVEGMDHLLVRNYGHGTKKSTLSSGGESITSLNVSPDGRLVAVGTKVGSVIFWQGKTGKPLLKKKVHSGSVLSMDFSFDSRFFASIGEDSLMVFRTLATGREKVVNLKDCGQLAVLLFIPDGLDLVTGSADGDIRIWASRAKKCLHTVKAHSGPITALTVSPKGDFFVSSGAGGDIKIWDRHSGELLQQFSGLHDTLTDLLLLDDNRHLVSCGEDGMIRLWDLVTGEVVFLLDGRGNGIRSLSKGAHPHFFFAGQQNGGLLIWKLIYNLTFN
ncbi:MAG: protein kinase [Desulfobulbaceae bacterium]|nr:protein kinase [Desulfobulbaceae bacterium]